MSIKCKLVRLRITDLHFEQPAAVRLKVTVVNLAHSVHVLVPDLLGNGALIGQQELVEKSAEHRKENEKQGETFGRGLPAPAFKDREIVSSRWETSHVSSPVLEQRVLWNLVVGHRLPEGVDLLQDELTDLGHGLEKPQAHTFRLFHGGRTSNRLRLQQLTWRLTPTLTSDRGNNTSVLMLCTYS